MICLPPQKNGHTFWKHVLRWSIAMVTRVLATQCLGVCCVCLYASVCVCLRVIVCTSLCASLRMCVRRYVFMCVLVCTSLCVSRYECLCVCVGGSTGVFVCRCGTPRVSHGVPVCKYICLSLCVCVSPCVCVCRTVSVCATLSVWPWEYVLVSLRRCAIRCRCLHV